MPGYDKINGKVTVAAYTYDDLGRVHTKSIHNGRETTTYAYDLAGRRISASSPSFSYTLGYDFPTLDGPGPGTTACSAKPSGRPNPWLRRHTPTLTIAQAI